MMPMDIKTLYALVTEAIRKSEVLEELNAPGARGAYLDVSLLEERIASLLPASDDEGAIARRGAVAAAIDAHEFGRAQELAARFSAEDGIDSALSADLAELQASATEMAGRDNLLTEKPVRRAAARDRMDRSSGALAGALREAVVRELKKSGKFTLPSFGTFSVHRTKARKAIDPITGKSIKQTVDKTVRFEASPTLKKAV